MLSIPFHYVQNSLVTHASATPAKAMNNRTSIIGTSFSMHRVYKKPIEEAIPSGGEYQRKKTIFAAPHNLFFSLLIKKKIPPLEENLSC